MCKIKCTDCEHCQQVKQRLNVCEGIYRTTSTTCSLEPGNRPKSDHLHQSFQLLHRLKVSVKFCIYINIVISLSVTVVVVVTRRIACRTNC